MKIVCFTLSMPHCASWNGRWSGEDRFYAKIKRIKKDDKLHSLKEDDVKSWHYKWDDGWGASIEARVVTSKEATKIRNKSCGFCGYGWMIDSILKNDKIIDEKKGINEDE